MCLSYMHMLLLMLSLKQMLTYDITTTSSASFVTFSERRMNVVDKIPVIILMMKIVICVVKLIKI
jgi:hypothetical protein